MNSTLQQGLKDVKLRTTDQDNDEKVLNLYTTSLLFQRITHFLTEYFLILFVHLDL